MFCTKCGSTLTPGTQFCVNCGAPIENAPPAAPVNRAVAQPEEAPKKRSSAPKLILLILTLCCAAILVAGYFTTLNTSLEDIPVISLLLDVEDADSIDKEKDKLADSCDDLEERYEKEKDDLSDKECKIVEKTLKACKGISKSISINNIKQFIKLADEVADLEIDGQKVIEDDTLEDIDELKEMFSIVEIIMLVAIGVCLLFSLLGGFCKAGALVIIGMIFSGIYTWAFSGIIFLIGAIVVHIAMFVCIRIIKR